MSQEAWPQLHEGCSYTRDPLDIPTGRNAAGTGSGQDVDTCSHAPKGVLVAQVTQLQRSDVLCATRDHP
jgi:hypothetical protein